MTWDIYIILDTVINGVNYCCHPVSYRTVQSFRAAVLAWWGEKLCCERRGHESNPQQQFMCASLHKRTLKLHRGSNASCTYRILRGVGRENKNSLLDATAVMAIHCW